MASRFERWLVLLCFWLISDDMSYMDLTSALFFQPPPIKATDNQLSLADIDVIKVVGKGNGGVVQLVQHKWTSQFFALKVYLLHIAHLALNMIVFSA